MKVTGASRRSAAPGSQFVGVAGYSDDPCAPSSSRRTLGRIRTIRGPHPTQAPIQAVFRLRRWRALARAKRYATVAVTSDAHSQDNVPPLPPAARFPLLPYPVPT
jgi:hypothetical protein